MAQTQIFDYDNGESNITLWMDDEKNRIIYIIGTPDSACTSSIDCNWDSEYINRHGLLIADTIWKQFSSYKAAINESIGKEYSDV